MKPADYLASGDWLPLDDAFARVKRLVGSDRPALHALKQDLLEGRIAALEQSIIRAGDSKTRELPAEFWQKAELSVDNVGGINKVYVKAKRENDQAQPVEYFYYLQRSDVEKRWLSEAAAASNAPLPPGRKSPAGAKADYDWEAILIEAAAYVLKHDPSSLSKLCAHIEKWCGKDAPGETQLKRHLGPLYDRLKKI
jgi:hypothetical protein